MSDTDQLCPDEDVYKRQGVDISEMNEADILDADEVFAIGDGRFLIVEA